MAELGIIEWYRGDSFSLEFTVQDEDDDAIDLTGSSLLFTVNSTKNPTDITDQEFEVAGVLDPDQVANKGKVSFSPTTTHTDLTPGTYYYDIQLTNASSQIRTIVKNKFKIIQDITKT